MAADEREIVVLLHHAPRVLDYLVKVWRRPIVLNTVNGEGAGFEVAARPV